MKNQVQQETCEIPRLYHTVPPPKGVEATESRGIQGFAEFYPEAPIEVGLLTGGSDKPYALGLSMALASKSVYLDFIGSDELDSPELRATPNLRFLNLRGDQRDDASLAAKIRRISLYYARLIRYASVTETRIFHILWNNRFEALDRTLLMLYYKLQGKKIAFTAHNVNASKRDGSDSLVNRLTLRIQYHLADHIFVHTEKMKRDLCEMFNIRESAVTVIPFGINNTVPNTDLTSAGAKQRLGIADGERTILFFGRIGPYKGLEILIQAFQQITAQHGNYRLVIVGSPKKGAADYLREIQRKIDRDIQPGRIIQKIEFVRDEDTELYFKAADVLILPYTSIFQSGVLYLGYGFGLPVIASDVGSMREEIIEGRTGFLCKPCDAADLARVIDKYFESELFKNLDTRRQSVRDYANTHHSWDVVGDMTKTVYAKLVANRSPRESNSQPYTESNSGSIPHTRDSSR